MTQQASSVKPSPSVLRAARALQLLAESNGRVVGLKQMADHLQAPKSSVANICAALVEAGLVSRSPDGGGYSLGRGVVELGGAYLTNADHVSAFHRTVGHLRYASVETVQLAVLDETDVIYLARHDGEQVVRLTSDIGRRIPADCTATGKAVLAEMDERTVRRLYERYEFSPRTPNAISSEDDLIADLSRTRARGYALDNEETSEGVICYGVGLPGVHRGEGIALSVTLLKVRDSDEMRQRLVGDLKVLASAIATPFT